MNELNLIEILETQPCTLNGKLEAGFPSPSQGKGLLAPSITDPTSAPTDLHTSLHSRCCQLSVGTLAKPEGRREPRSPPVHGGFLWLPASVGTVWKYWLRQCRDKTPSGKCFPDVWLPLLTQFKASGDAIQSIGCKWRDAAPSWSCYYMHVTCLPHTGTQSNQMCTKDVTWKLPSSCDFFSEAHL